MHSRRGIPGIPVREGIYLKKEVPHVSPDPNEWDTYLRGKECMRYVTVYHVCDRAYVPTLI